MSEKPSLEEISAQVRAIAATAGDLVSALGKDGYSIYAILAGLAEAISVTTAALTAVGMDQETGRKMLQLPMLEAYERGLLSADKIKLILQKPEGSA